MTEEAKSSQVGPARLGTAPHHVGGVARRRRRGALRVEALVAADVDAKLVREYRQAGATAVLATNLIHSPDQKMADIITEARALRKAWLK